MELLKVVVVYEEVDEAEVAAVEAGAVAAVAGVDVEGHSPGLVLLALDKAGHGRVPAAQEDARSPARALDHKPAPGRANSVAPCHARGQRPGRALNCED